MERKQMIKRLKELQVYDLFNKALVIRLRKSTSYISTSLKITGVNNYGESVSFSYFNGHLVSVTGELMLHDIQQMTTLFDE